MTTDHGALPVLYVDAHIAVVNKPAGVMAHDSKLARGETDFVADRLRVQFGKPIFLIHRLDRATSGCLLVAFDRESASTLGKVLMSREVRRTTWPSAAAGPSRTSPSITPSTAARASRRRSPR